MDDVKKHNELSLIIDDRQWLPAAPAGSERQNKRASCSLRALACNVTALLTCLGSEGGGAHLRCLLASGPASLSDRCQQVSATVKHRRRSLLCVTWNEKADGVVAIPPLPWPFQSRQVEIEAMATAPVWLTVNRDQKQNLLLDPKNYKLHFRL